MKKRNWIAVLAILTGTAFNGTVVAQVYRCGNTYQDRPCDAAQGGKPLNASSGTPSAPAGTAIDDDCAQRGIAAQRIMWAREAGQTADTQLAAANSSLQRKLIGSVYRKRGSAPEVRTAIESECAAEKQRDAQAATLLEAAARLRAQDDPAAGPGTGSPSPTVKGTATASLADGSEDERMAVAKRTRCSALRDRAETLRSEQRAGATAARMDSLNKQRRVIDDSLRSEGC
jgi:hypothetical protein